MILPFLAAATLATLPGGDRPRFAACVALTRSDVPRAVVEAEAWAGAEKSVTARHCLGLAYSAAQRWTSAAAVFEQAATDAEAKRDPRDAALWAAAGNAALAADDAARARADLDRALPSPAMTRVLRGEAFIDRARADVALKEETIARADLDQALMLVPEDPFVWLLSATLARRQKAYDRAEGDIGEALRLAPDDASVALEAGNIAAARGVISAARLAWEKAVALDPKGPPGQSAATALSANR